MSGNTPKTFEATGRASGAASRTALFDPALKHFSSAYRHGDPEGLDPKSMLRWQQARRQASDRVLRVISDSEWGDKLVLRGSRLLQATLGEAAREPGDLDWIVTPPSVRPDDAWGREMLAGLAAAVYDVPGSDKFTFRRDLFVTDEIWTYERAEGRRIVFPWELPGLPGGAVQVDIVFCEEPGEPAVVTSIPVCDGAPVEIWGATPGQALAWKLVWLATDMHSQGKDLYDAALLAERVFLPRSLLDTTYRRSAQGRTGPDLSLQWLQWLSEMAYVEWEHFQKECPWVEGTERDWQQRLLWALAPTFADCEQPERSIPLCGDWRTPDVLAIARGIRDGGDYSALPILADALEEAGCVEPGILDHCRAGGAHDASCWVIELLREEPTA